MDAIHRLLRGDQGQAFRESAQGAFRFIAGSDDVTYISGGSLGWVTISSRAAMIIPESVDIEAVLDGIDDMDIST